MFLIYKINPSLSTWCRNVQHAKYVLDLIDAPVDMDHDPSQNTSPTHQLYSIFSRYLTTDHLPRQHEHHQPIPDAPSNDDLVLATFVDVVIVASETQKKLYSSVPWWSKVKFVVVRS